MNVYHSSFRSQALIKREPDNPRCKISEIEIYVCAFMGVN